eukprot:2731015-Rhodomonas_salina.3
MGPSAGLHCRVMHKQLRSWFRLRFYLFELSLCLIHRCVSFCDVEGFRVRAHRGVAERIAFSFMVQNGLHQREVMRAVPFAILDLPNNTVSRELGRQRHEQTSTRLLSRAGVECRVSSVECEC